MVNCHHICHLLATYHLGQNSTFTVSCLLLPLLLNDAFNNNGTSAKNHGAGASLVCVHIHTVAYRQKQCINVSQSKANQFQTRALRLNNFHIHRLSSCVGQSDCQCENSKHLCFWILIMYGLGYPRTSWYNMLSERFFWKGVCKSPNQTFRSNVAFHYSTTQLNCLHSGHFSLSRLILQCYWLPVHSNYIEASLGRHWCDIWKLH